MKLRKQVFCKTDVLKYSLKAWNYNMFQVKSHRKTPLLESFFKEVTRSENYALFT